MSERYDCIIVGAGPAGITAAYKLAGAGLNVLVFERGEFPGSKNKFGGILYSTILNKLIPEFWKEAPVERHVVRRRYSFLSKDSEAACDLKFDAFNNPPYNHSFTVLRARFDKWFAKKAEEAGAVIVTDAVVDDFITEGGNRCCLRRSGRRKSLNLATWALAGKRLSSGRRAVLRPGSLFRMERGPA